MNKMKFLVLLAISCALTSTAVALVSAFEGSSARRGTNSSAVTFGAASLQRVDGLDVPDDLVRRDSLSSHLRGPFLTLGNRLERRGKERVFVMGTLQRNGEEATPFGLIWEIPGRLRLEVIRGGQQQITTFDGSRIGQRGGNIQTRDEDLLETLIYDSAEHLFVSQMQGAATRFLGSRFRLIEDPHAEYSGPLYDIFEVTEQIAFRRRPRQQTRQYFFNSEPHFLEAVKYRVMSGGLESQVEVRLESWQQLNGQGFPSRIVRLENESPVLTVSLNLASITVSPRIEDGIFVQATNP